MRSSRLFGSLTFMFSLKGSHIPRLLSNCNSLYNFALLNKSNFIKLEEMLFKFDGDKIKVVTSPKKWITINLVVGEYQQKFVDAWRRGELDVGEIIIKPDFVIVPFKKDVKPQISDTVMTIDVNEKNVTYSIFREKDVIKTVKLDIYKVKRIHDEHSKKRGKIQKNSQESQ